MPKCILDGCDDVAVYRNMCRRHYWRVRYYERRDHRHYDVGDIKWHGKSEIVTNDGEEWRSIIDANAEYEVSNFGRVRVKKGGIWVECAPHMDRRYGYIYASIKLGNKFYMRAVHRLVAEAFIEKPQSKNEVNHIDGNKQNNNASNLEWCTRSENMLHAREVLGVCSRRSGARAVECIDTGERFSSMNEAALIKDSSAAAISAAASGKKVTAAGLRWKFIV